MNLKACGVDIGFSAVDFDPVDKQDLVSQMREFEYMRGTPIDEPLVDSVSRFIESKDQYFFHLLPDLIEFAFFINSLADEDTHICFLSRDCYFLYMLYSVIFAGDANFEYVFGSRKLCYSDNSYYVAYVGEILAKAPKTLWVDIQGSGDSHVYFFGHHFGYVPTKVMFRKNTLQRCNPRVADADIAIYDQIITFKKPEWRLLDDRLIDPTHGAFTLESLCRAPHPSVVSFDESFKPVFEAEYDLLDRNFGQLFRAYDYVLSNLWCDERIRLRSNPCINSKSLTPSRSACNGLLALDIDETITHDEHDMLEQIVKYSIDSSIQIVFITARWDPFYANHNGYLKDIFSNFPVDLIGLTDLWYNPFSRGSQMDFNNDVKIQQMNVASSELGLSADKCMLVDNVKSTVVAAQNAGHVFSTHVPCDNKIGVTQEVYDNLKRVQLV